jgi:hypothetical protein
MENISQTALYFTIFLLIICFYMKSEEYFNGLIKVTINGNTYKVREDNKLESAKKLDKLNQKITILIKHLNKVDPEYYGVKRLKNRYKQSILSELHKGSSNTSYSVNKGEKLVVCMRSKDDNTFHEDNTIFFVVLHELAHIMTKSIGHNEEFWNNFRYLLKHCIEIKLYNYQDFNNKPEDYCGIQITDTPYKMS